MLPLYKPRAPSFLTVWMKTSMGPFCILWSAPYRRKTRRGLQTYLLRCKPHTISLRLDVKFSRHSRGAIWALVLMVSSGCPTRTCAAPPTLPAMSSLTVLRSAMVRGRRWWLREKGGTRPEAVGHHSTGMASTSPALIDDSHPLRGSDSSSESSTYYRRRQSFGIVQDLAQEAH